MSLSFQEKRIVTMLNKTKKFKLINHFPYLVVFSFFLVFFIFLTSSVNVKADNTYILPYNVVDYENNNSILLVNNRSILGDAYTRIYNQISNDRYFANGFDLDNYYILPVYSAVNNSGDLPVTLYFVSGVTWSDTSSFGSIYSNYLTGTLSDPAPYVSYNIHSDGSYSYQSIWYRSDGNNTYCFGSYAPTSFGDYTYQNYYPVSSTNYFYDSADNLVITVDFEWTPEDSVFNDFQNALDITSTISNGIDNTLNDIENQKGFFDNLVSNLKNMFNSLNGWINNAFSFLSSTIKNFFGPFLRNIQNFISNISGSLDDFKDKFAKFFEIIASIYSLGVINGEFDFPTLIVHLVVPEVDDMYQLLNQYTIGVAINGIVSYTSDVLDFIFIAFNAPSVKVYHLPDFQLGGQTFSGYVVDFSWYDPYKPYCDAIISFFLLINYGMFLFRFAPRFFRAAGSGYSEAFDLIEDLTPEVHQDHSSDDFGYRAPSMFDFM